jgi:nucleoside-diphosphate-sugar epimerase
MHALVTGAAGFIGSHLTESLLADGHTVTAVDSFTDYYDVGIKRANAEGLRAHAACTFVDGDLLTTDLVPLLGPVDVVFHQAGQPGVRLSWGEGFAVYNDLNVLATQRLLEASRTAGIERFVYASSSSVYGNAVRYPTSETDLPQPMSPYGVTKLAGEHLCVLYARQWDVPTVALRYFTVYGPRQRPDMAFHRLARAALTGEPFPLYGTGDQIRDFTYVDDVVEANRLAATAALEPGTVMNIAGGGAARLGDLIDLAGELAGREVVLDRQPVAPGDVARTGGTIDRAVDLLGWKPATDVTDGLRAEIDWMRTILG